jgi:hypothetical protein
VAWLLSSACSGELTPQETAAAFWSAVIEQDVANVIKHSTLTEPYEYDGFSRDWHGFQPAWGKLVIDGDEASIATTLTRPGDPNGQPVELVTYLVRQTGPWQVDYVRTREAMHSPLTGLFKRLDRMSQQLSEQLRLTSSDAEAEIERLAVQLEQLSSALGRKAADSIEAYAETMRRSIDRFAESVDRALQEQELPKRDRQLLKEASADLHRESKRLSRPSAQIITDSSRVAAAARQRLGTLDADAMAPYQEQWQARSEEIEARMRRMLDELTTLQNSRQD